MGFFDLFKGKAAAPRGGLGVEDLARRLAMAPAELAAFKPGYSAFSVPKRSGGERRILAPDAATKALQRKVLRTLLGKLKAHPAALGFERGQSIVTNARAHVGKAVVLRLDLRNFFESTKAEKVADYFGAIGWNREAADLLVRISTFQGGLPQGAPTSPRLSNLVNFRLDARIAAWAEGMEATYTRYADDMTISFEEEDEGDVAGAIRMVKEIAADEGYELHLFKKLLVRRRHQRQFVTGLVVNQKISLPRTYRRWLRAVEHRIAKGKEATLTPAQLAGWKSFRAMIAAQSQTPSP